MLAAAVAVVVVVVVVLVVVVIISVMVLVIVMVFAAAAAAAAAAAVAEASVFVYVMTSTAKIYESSHAQNLGTVLVAVGDGLVIPKMKEPKPQQAEHLKLEALGTRSDPAWNPKSIAAGSVCYTSSIQCQHPN